METEKNKIEFWEAMQKFEDALNIHKPETPMPGEVSVSVVFTSYADIDTSKPHSVYGNYLPVLAMMVCSELARNGFIRDENQVVSLSIEKRESRTPGIAFIMQEAE